jgi:NADH-quinone oxidoreductase subunit B
MDLLKQLDKAYDATTQEPMRNLARRYQDTPPGVRFISIVDKVLNTGKACSLWPLQFGLACCAIEMIATAGPRYDLDRFGIIMRASPRQADCMIVAGTVSVKMAPVVERLYHQMPEPRWVIALGNCAVSGGRFYQHAYSVVKGVDRVIPVDIYIPGCPPRPESLVDGLLKLHDLIREESITDRPRHERWEAEHQLPPEAAIR